MQQLDRIRYYYELANEKVDFDLKSKQSTVMKAYDRLKDSVENSGKPIYGIHTGYGDNVRDEKNPDNWVKDQLLLLNYLQVGVGDKLPDSVVRRALRFQALKVARGFSGTSVETFEKLCKLSAAKKMPVVPKYGSLGASGDLIPMAHAIAPIFEDYVPQGPRDVISLVNTNSMMASYAIENYQKLQVLFQKTIQFIAYATVGCDANMQHFDTKGFAMNPQKEIQDVCELINLEREKFLKSFDIVDGQEYRSVQEKYSIRCFPQIAGQICRNLDYVRGLLIDEIEQVSDNPLVLENGEMWHGGHFYAVGIATASDLMTDACYRLAEVIDRVVLILMDKNLNKGLPNNLQLDDMDHVKGIHQMISSLLQRMRSLSFPSSLMSFSCEGNNQDVVPCSMNAQNQLSDLLKLFEKVVEGGHFCAERAALIRLEQHVPMRLRLKQWRYQNV